MKIGQLNAIFRQGHYNTANLSRSLNALYGDAKLADSLRSLVIPAYNIDGEQLTVIEEAGETDETPVHTMNNFTDSGGHALWMKNILFNTDMNTHKPPLNVTLYDAVMASAAAPTYFPCHHFKASQPGIAAEHEYTAIDGSIFDNPCISYAGALRQHLTPGQKLVMIGLGTGTVNRSVKKEAWNSYGSLGVVDPVNDLPLINILFHASESALMESFAAEMSGHLYLFNKSLVKDREKDWPNTQLDDGSPENLKKLKNFAELIIEENQALFDEVCHILATNRDRMEKEKPFLDKLKTKIFSSS